MTDTAGTDEAVAEQSLDDLRAQAISLLTRASRMRRPRYVMRGGEVMPDGDATEPIDFSEFVTHVLASVAANRGGIGPLLAGRPSSWEADKLNDILVSTVGEDEAHMFEHRTEPVVVPLAVEDVLLDAGEFEPYEPEDREQEIVRRAEAAGISVEDWLARWRGREPVFTRWQPLLAPEDWYDEQLNEIENRHSDAYDALEARYPEGTDYSVYEAEAERLDDQRAAEADALRERWQRRYQRYATAFEAAVRAKAAELRVTVPIEVRVETDPERTWDARKNTPSAWNLDDLLAARLYEHARLTTPVSPWMR
jgi:hypothetical protein